MKNQLSLIPPSPKYVFDTNVFGDFWDIADPYRAYPIDLKPHRETWEYIEKLMRDGLIVAPSEVKDQLLASDLDELKEWIKIYAYVFVDMDICPGIQDHLRLIYEKNPGYESPKADVVDAVVVATAMSLKAAVVSSEKRNTNPNPGFLPKVPNVCDDMSIPCHNINEFLRVERY